MPIHLSIHFLKKTSHTVVVKSQSDQGDECFGNCKATSLLEEPWHAIISSALVMLGLEVIHSLQRTYSCLAHVESVSDHFQLELLVQSPSNHSLWPAPYCHGMQLSSFCTVVPCLIFVP